MFFKTKTTPSTESFCEKLQALRRMLREADAVVIGAGAGLSASAGFSYGGETFHRYFADFEEAYGFHDMYSGGFYPFPNLEEHWAFWSRQIFLNRYCDPPKPVYETLLGLVKDKDYFVLTTNVDHCFQKAGFSKARLFYTQGDYGLWQCATPCHEQTYDNEAQVRRMVEAQGFRITEKGLEIPDGAALKRAVPAELVPHCPRCGAPMTMNLRVDGTFVEDRGWHAAAGRYRAFLDRHRKDRVRYLELGVGMNTPGIIKYPFWQKTYENPDARYICLNLSEAYCPPEIERQSLCLGGDIGEILAAL